MQTDSKRIIIVGAGFGGTRAYLELYKLFGHKKDINVTLINNTDYFWFTPMAHEVATGNLMPDTLKQSLRTLPQTHGFNFIEGEVREIDVKEKTVTFAFSHPTTEEESETTHILHFDYLVSALGAVTSFFGVPGADTYSLPLKTLDDVRAIKNKILHTLEESQCPTEDEEELRNKLRFVIVGGGPTGVELAGELADIMRHEVKKFFPDIARYVSVILLQRGDSLIAQGEEWFAEESLKILTSKGVDVRLNATVIEVKEDGVQCEGEFIPSQTVMWTAGVQASKISTVPDVETQERTGRIKVSHFLNIPEYPYVFIIGDQAWVKDKEHEQGYPMRAQFATRQGKCAARNIQRLLSHEPLEEFYWKDKGFIISFGNGKALAKIFGIEFKGPFAWWLYRTAYLPQIIGWRARLRTVFEWTLNLFLPRDMSEI